MHRNGDKERNPRTRKNHNKGMDSESYRDIDGVWMHTFFSEETVRSAMKYKPRNGDVIIVTYPKCGTTWTMYIVYNILTRANNPGDFAEFRRMSPYIDLTGAKPAEHPLRVGPVMTHLPLEVFQPVDKAKYIYVARNPYDCAVSYYHFILGMTPKSVTDVSFGKFLDLFVAGKVIYGDYFDHLLPWYGRRSDPNVLFLTYEELKANTRAQVLRIAEFIGEDHGKAFHEDEQLVRRLLDACSLESMKVLCEGFPGNRTEDMAQASSGLSKGNQAHLQKTHQGSGFVRKGIVGDWKNYFTAEQIQATKRWIAEKTRGSDVMKLWSGLDLP